MLETFPPEIIETLPAFTFNPLTLALYETTILALEANGLSAREVQIAKLMDQFGLTRENATEATRHFMAATSATSEDKALIQFVDFFQIVSENSGLGFDANQAAGYATKGLVTQDYDTMLENLIKLWATIYKVPEKYANIFHDAAINRIAAFQAKESAIKTGNWDNVKENLQLSFEQIRSAARTWHLNANHIGFYGI